MSWMIHYQTGIAYLSISLNFIMTDTDKQRDFSLISPSARSLLLLKGLTTIPYARQAAELIMLPEKYEPDFTNKDFAFWARVLHFENRYAMINQLLSDLSTKNILELSGGFSFRGLDSVSHSAVHYIDTDLPEVIDLKKRLVQKLTERQPAAKGELELLPLNALDEYEFNKVVSHFNNEPITIVNEGLLVYLNKEEKLRLCSTIRGVLKKRGGCWITADIYIKFNKETRMFQPDDKLQRFFDQHHIEENKFVSFEEAEDFFRKAGFVVEKEAKPDYPGLSTFSYFQNTISSEQLGSMGKAPKIQATWQLRPA
jgi:O-methyltransferase involved in polyketide biosynthesis